MAQWHISRLEDLARQLAYSPEEKRSAQWHAATDLLASIDPAKDYPWEYVLFRITGYRPRELQDEALRGGDLRRDLAQLIELLAETLSISVATVPEPVLSLEEVMEHFNVSSKTIQRWRRLGLLAHRYVFGDGRKRLGFRRSQVARFAEQNAERVAQAGTFKQLSDDEREKIIEMARRFSARCQCCIKDISLRIGRRLNRSPETVRYTIRKHDRDHPATAIFPEPGEDLRTHDRTTILQYHDRGLTLDAIARRYCRTPSSIETVLVAERAERLKTQPIEFMPNALFSHPDADTIVLQTLPAQALERARQTVATGTNATSSDLLMARAPRDLPSPLAAIFRQPVMPQELETDTFRRMNYLKSKAARLASALDPTSAAAGPLDEIDRLLAEAHTLMNQILQSNLRVAVHVARQHQRPGRALMELVSDATVWLMRAAEKFDFARGVKFSTYASYAIMKNFARHRAEAIAGPDRQLVTGQEALLEQLTDRPANQDEALDTAALQGELAAALRELPARERELIVAHYGIGDARAALSLQQLGDKLGVSKARARQLQIRALKRLRDRLESRQPAPGPQVSAA
jgi:RNA polymerase sigma factor (sigma-70 family)